MAASSETEKLLECSVCLHLFKDPRILPCGHSFCANCISDWSRESQVITCPDCRSTTQLPLKSLAINYALQNAVQALVESKNPDEKRSNERKYVCNGCKTQHFITDVWTCEKCDLKLICSACGMKNHQQHGTLDIATVLKTSQEQVDHWRKGIENSTKEMVSRRDQIGTNYQEAIGQLRIMHSALCDEFGPQFDNVMQKIEVDRNSILAKVNSLDIRSLVASGRLNIELTDLSKELETLIDKQNILKEDGQSVLEILKDANKRIKQILSRIHKVIKSEEQPIKKVYLERSPSEVPPSPSPRSTIDEQCEASKRATASNWMTAICQKYMCHNIRYKVVFYFVFVTTLSLLGDQGLSSPAYLRLNRLNQGLALTLALLLPFTYYTAKVCGGGNRRIIIKRVARLVVPGLIMLFFYTCFRTDKELGGPCIVLSGDGYYSAECEFGERFWSYIKINPYFLIVYCCLVIEEETKVLRDWDFIPSLLNRSGSTETYPVEKSLLTEHEKTIIREQYAKYTVWIRLLFLALTLCHLFWEFLLVIFSLYISGWPEKFTGVCLAACAWYAIYGFWYKKKAGTAEHFKQK